MSCVKRSGLFPLCAYHKRQEKIISLAFRLIQGDFSEEQLGCYRERFRETNGFIGSIRSFCKTYNIQCELDELIGYLNERHVDGITSMDGDVYNCVLQLGWFLWKNNPRYDDVPIKENSSTDKRKKTLGDYLFFTKQQPEKDSHSISNEAIEQKLTNLWHGLNQLRCDLPHNTELFESHHQPVKVKIDEAYRANMFWERPPSTMNRRSTITMGEGLSCYAEQLSCRFRAE